MSPPPEPPLRWRLECTWTCQERTIYEVSSYATEAQALATQAERARTGVEPGQPWDTLRITPYVPPCDDARMPPTIDAIADWCGWQEQMLGPPVALWTLHQPLAGYPAHTTLVQQTLEAAGYHGTRHRPRPPCPKPQGRCVCGQEVRDCHCAQAHTWVRLLVCGTCSCTGAERTIPMEDEA